MLCRALTEYDSVTFCRYLETILATETTGPYGAVAYWIVLDSANTLIQVARERVYKMEGAKEVPELERPGKWKALQELLAESTHSTGTILIMTRSEYNKRQLQSLVVHGEEATMNQAYDGYQKWKRQAAALKAANTLNVPCSRKRQRPLPSTAAAAKEPPKVEEPTQSEEQPQDVLNVELDSPNIESTISALIERNIHVCTYNSSRNLVLLNSIKPSIVILYDMAIDFVRSLEIYQATREFDAEPGAIPELHVFTLSYKDSTEEQAHLLAIRREKVAFESLIKAKAVQLRFQSKDTHPFLSIEPGCSTCCRGSA